MELSHQMLLIADFLRKLFFEHYLIFIYDLFSFLLSLNNDFPEILYASDIKIFVFLSSRPRSAHVASALTSAQEAAAVVFLSEGRNKVRRRPIKRRGLSSGLSGVHLCRTVGAPMLHLWCQGAALFLALLFESLYCWYAYAVGIPMLYCWYTYAGLLV